MRTARLLPCPRRPSARGPEAPDLGDGADEKKRRESRRSGFLHLIRPRPRPERPPSALMADEPGGGCERAGEAPADGEEARRCGVQAMAGGLLAEMKAKQGRRAAGAHQVSPAPSPRGGRATPGRPARPG